MAVETFAIEVFAPGLHAGRQWTTAHVDALVSNFQRLKGFVKPPIRLGHSDKQALAQSDGQPALGHVENLRRVGDVVVADVANVPAPIRQAMKQKLYRRVSPGFYTDWEKTPYEANVKSGAVGPVLQHVALEGADVPEIKSLADLDTYLASERAQVVDADAPITMELGEPTIVDSAPALDADAGEAAGPVALSPTTMATLAETVATKLAALWRPGRHPRNPDPSDADPQQGDAPMTDAEKQTLREELTAQFAEERKAEQTERETLQAEVLKLTEAKTATEAEVQRLAKEADAARQREATLAAQAAHTEAVRFAEQALGKATIVKAQVPLLTALHELASAEPVIQPEAAVAMHLAETPDKALSLRDVLCAFVESMPAIRPVGEQAHAGRGATDLDTALQQIATEKGLKLSEPQERQQALALLAERSTGDLVPDYRTPTDHRTRH